ncbi:ankyrin repeat-containing protein npr4 [Fagus crenata]
MSEVDLNDRDDDKFTFLGYSAIIGNIKNAESIIGRSWGELRIGNRRHEIIPVVVALAYGNTEMAHYLYSLTPPQELELGKGVNGATFITQAIYAKAFGNNLI